jgi:VanZ family protein
MPPLAELRISFAERKLLRWLFLFYCLFILYGSFIPFRFSDDPEFVRSQFVRFFTLPYHHGVRKFSIPDVLSNILLFIPFGFLWIGGKFSLRASNGLWSAILAGGALGFLCGLTIESGQMFSPGRIASILDALCNGLGSAFGAAAGYLLFRAFRGSFGLILMQLLQQRPSLVLLALLLFAAMADAYYPFDITLDVSSVWHNLKNTRLIPFAGGLRRFWLDLFVEKSLLFAAIGYLALRNLPKGTAHARTLAWAACSAIAVLIEGGKLFFAGRAPNVDNVVFSALGALGGVVLVPPLAATALVRQHARQILVILILCIIAYAELSPFDWIRSLEQIPFRIAMIEWLPFSSYYVAEPQAALFDLAKKLFLLGPLGFVIAAGNRDGSSRKPQVLAAAAGLLIGLLLEAGQIALQSRTPSMTDVLLFGGAAWTGAVVCERYRRIRDART